MDNLIGNPFTALQQQLNSLEEAQSGQGFRLRIAKVSSIAGGTLVIQYTTDKVLDTPKFKDPDVPYAVGDLVRVYVQDTIAVVGGRITAG